MFKDKFKNYLKITKYYSKNNSPFHPHPTDTIAPGYRGAGYNERLGVLMSNGHYGFGWSSTTSGSGGLDLHFNSQGLIPDHADYRGRGFQLRCLSE